MNRFRFNLTTLLLLTGVLAICAGYISQSGFEEALFEIKSNELKLDEDGIVRGELECRCKMLGLEPTKMVCRVERSLDESLLKLAVAQVIPVRYRRWPPLGLLDKQDPYGIFLTHKLGFAADEIVGQIIRRDESTVVVREKFH